MIKLFLNRLILIFCFCIFSIPLNAQSNTELIDPEMIEYLNDYFDYFPSNMYMEMGVTEDESGFYYQDNQPVMIGDDPLVTQISFKDLRYVQKVSISEDKKHLVLSFSKSVPNYGNSGKKKLKKLSLDLSNNLDEKNRDIVYNTMIQICKYFGAQLDSEGKKISYKRQKHYYESRGYLGLNGGLPQGEAGDFYSFNLGAEMNILFTVVEYVWGLGGYVSYDHFFSKTEGSINYLALGLSTNIYIDRFFVGGNFGYSYGLYSDIDKNGLWGISIQPRIGVRFKKIELSLTYKRYEATVVNQSIGMGVGFVF